ncbi:MAG: hypothetical protein R3F20_09885 [Planctomycetota bacterium]
MSEQGRGFWSLIGGTVATAALAGLAVLTISSGRPGGVPLERRGDPLPLAAVDSATPGDPEVERRLEVGMAEVWRRYLESRDGSPRGLEDFRRFLDELGIGDAKGRRVRSAFLLSLLGEESRIEAVEVIRSDEADRSTLRFVLSARDEAGRPEEIESDWVITGEPFRGLDFALLARNVNCVMCHAHIDNAARVYNTDLLRVGSFDRVRVGTLSHFQIRPQEARSLVAGTLYTRGGLYDAHGQPLDISDSTLKSVEFDADGHLVEDAFGELVSRPFAAAAEKGGTLYLNYPTDEAQQPDGPLPTHFPSVIPDLDEDRIVDDEEFAITAASARGRLTGGFKVLTPEGRRYEDGGLPDVDRDPRLEDVVRGHLVMKGTLLDPIRVSGVVAVDGDLVLAGAIRGEGAIVVRGDVYVVDSLEYADGLDGEGRRTFGVAADGRPNRVALAAGGSIIVGDPLANPKTFSAGIVTGDKSGGFNFTMSEILIFNRMEWTPTQRHVPGPGGRPIPNPLHDPRHLARYYTLEPGDPIYVMNNPEGDRVWFDAESRAWAGLDSLGDWSWGGWTEYLPEHPMVADALVTPLLPGAWLPPASYRGMLNEATNSRDGFKVDGLLYTSNALMLAAPRHGVYHGRARINGAVIAADLGVLAPGDGESPGFVLNYDHRLEGLLDVRSTRRLQISPASR